MSNLHLTSVNHPLELATRGMAQSIDPIGDLARVDRELFACRREIARQNKMIEELARRNVKQEQTIKNLQPLIGKYSAAVDAFVKALQPIHTFDLGDPDDYDEFYDDGGDYRANGQRDEYYDPNPDDAEPA